MNIVQLLIILWARRLLICAATASCLIGALIVTAILPAQWEGTVRVMLNDLKPDPVTGEVLGQTTRIYEATQTALITDYSVAGRVAEQVGWLTSPTLAEAYRKRSKDDKRDFRRWLADRLIQSTKAKLLEGSNILEISYIGSDPDEAKAVADALRKAYMDSTLETRKEEAERNALWYADQVNRAKQVLDQATAAESAFERANGMVMQPDKRDADTARLQSLTQQSGPIAAAPVTLSQSSPASMELATVEAQIAVSRKTLGPNNPDVQSLESRRGALSALVAREKEAARLSEGRAINSGVDAYRRDLESQKTKVIAQSEKIGRLNQLHQDVELASDEYNRMVAKMAQFRAEAVSTHYNVTTLGSASVPKSPKFPNYLLIIPGSIILGLAVGVLVSLLLELLGRRVRSPADLANSFDMPLICVVPGPDIAKTRGSKPAGGRRGFWPLNQRSATA